ncbi:MAG: hypothetical protein A2V67_12225 [Deltaproteobacteria bacterium RBG_13_61_14]|nr:MAG: hypothetical protein A2V67_12225 [Deltaproteobacteria bacterium RBG_13_61_14]
MTERLVLDCSVAVKWYLLDEEDSDLARFFLLSFLNHDIEFHAPELLKYEVAHALTKAQRSQKRRFSQTEIQEGFHHFLKLPVKFHSLSDSVLEEVIAFANRFHRNFYDRCYLWLAEQWDCAWLTAEMKFHGPFPLGFPKNRIRLLGSKPPNE